MEMWVALLLCKASVVALWTALGRRPLAAARAEETLRAKAVPALREAALCATLMMRVEGAEEVQAEFAQNEKAVPRALAVYQRAQNHTPMCRRTRLVLTPVLGQWQVDKARPWTSHMKRPAVVLVQQPRAVPSPYTRHDRQQCSSHRPPSFATALLADWECCPQAAQPGACSAAFYASHGRVVGLVAGHRIGC